MAIQSILTLASGFPFDVTCQYCYSPSTRPNLIGPLHQINSPRNWFDTSSFGPVTTHQRRSDRSGTGPRKSIHGRGTKDMDLNISKTFAVTERIKIGFSVDFFQPVQPHHSSTSPTETSVMGVSGQSPPLRVIVNVNFQAGFLRTFYDQHEEGSTVLLPSGCPPP